MATMDKKSVREEFDRLKSAFDNISKEEKISPEVKLIFNGFIMLIEVILSIFLEKKTRKTSENSSKPPSQTEKDETSLTTKGSNRKGKSEQDHLANNTRTVETTTVLPVHYCDHCSESLKDTLCTRLERRTRIDILFEKTVEYFDAEVKECPNCHAQVKAGFPNDIKGPLQYGAGIKAFVVCLLVTQMVALKRTQKMLSSVI